MVYKEISLRFFYGLTCGDYTFFFHKQHNYDQKETILAVHFAGKQSNQSNQMWKLHTDCIAFIDAIEIILVLTLIFGFKWNRMLGKRYSGLMEQ